MRNDLHRWSALAVLAAVIGVAGCVSDQEPRRGEVPDLKRALTGLRGTYTWRGDLSRYEYSEKLKVEEILAEHPREHAVTVLIGCLDDTSASASMMADKPVAIGTICYEALTQLVYYEPTDPSGDVAAEWPGFLSPRASPQEMRNAKAAWQQAADANLLIFQ